MSPEQERVLYEVLEHSVETKTMLFDLATRVRQKEAEAKASLDEHVTDDEKAHGRITALEKHQTWLYAIYGATCVIVPAVWWLLSALNGSAHAQ